MKPHVSSGGYEIRLNDQPGLLPTGEGAARIYERWSRLHESSAALADAYLEGVVDGIKYEMT
jgi:hypothetical protein